MSLEGGERLIGMPEVFASGIQMGESPRWHDGRFWMCDWMAGEVLVFDAHGNRDRGAGGGAAVLDRLASRRAVGRDHARRAGGRAGPGALRASGQPFNEIVVDAAGRAWVDMPGSMPGEEPKPGLVAVVLPDGSDRQVADDVWFPNGMVVLGDDTLVLAESHADRLTAWTITDDGELVDRRVWADLGPGSAPDGICADAEGAIWYASVPGQRCTRVAEGGKVLDTVPADRGCFSCMLGGDDGRTLYIVANQWSDDGASDGVVLIHPVAVAHAGRP